MFCIDLPGVVIWQHIHSSTLHLFWEEGCQDSSCPRPESSRVHKFFWYNGMRPRCLTDMKNHTHCFQSFVSLDWIPSGTYTRGEEGQPHQSLVRTTFSSFSRLNHIEILVLSILFFLIVQSLKINTFFKNMATLGHKTWLE